MTQKKSINSFYRKYSIYIKNHKIKKIYKKNNIKNI